MIDAAKICSFGYLTLPHGLRRIAFLAIFSKRLITMPVRLTGRLFTCLLLKDITDIRIFQIIRRYRILKQLVKDFIDRIGIDWCQFHVEFVVSFIHFKVYSGVHLA